MEHMERSIAEKVVTIAGLCSCLCSREEYCLAGMARTVFWDLVAEAIAAAATQPEIVDTSGKLEVACSLSEDIPPPSLSRFVSAS